MFFIKKGKIALMGSMGLMEKLMGPGEHFGDLALLLSANRTDQAVALANSDLMALRPTDLAMCMKSFPKSAGIVRQAAMDKCAFSLPALRSACAQTLCSSLSIQFQVACTSQAAAGSMFAWLCPSVQRASTYQFLPVLLVYRCSAASRLQR